MSNVTRSSMQNALEEAAARHFVPGSVFALWNHGQLEIAQTGVLNVETGAAVRPDSMFQIGSITKVLTATLIMKLVDDGLVDLDATVRTYLPQFRVGDLEASRSVTVRQLLCHTSGLAGDFMTDTGAGSDRLAKFIDRCALLPLAHPVGNGFSYSNSAFKIARKGRCPVEPRKGKASRSSQHPHVD